MSSASLIGIFINNGVPLFVRHIGPGKPPPYSLIGSLNGVHVFGEAQGVTLCRSKTSSVKTIWKNYHDSIQLILIQGSECDSERADNVLLDLCFGAIVLFLGFENITSPQANFERLKKDTRASFFLLDELLGRYALGKDCLSFSHVTKCADYALPPDQLNIQPELEKFIESSGSSFGCLLRISGQILFATKEFWNLSSTELVLLPLLASSRQVALTVGRDIPIYLPDLSPNVPFRVLIIRLAGPLLLMTLCGSTPSLSEALKSSGTFWGSHFLTLDAITSATTCSLPSSLYAAMDHSIQGILVINYDTKRCISCLHFKEKVEGRLSGGHSKNTKSSSNRANILCSVYKSLIGPIFQPPAIPPEDLPTPILPRDHCPLHAYLSAEDFKVFIIQKSPYHIIILFPPLLPVHIARSISWKTLELLTKGKGIKL